MTTDKQIKKLTKEYQNSIIKILCEANSIEKQKDIMKHMVSVFSTIGLQKGVPVTLDYAVEVVRKHFPHLVEDMERLLLLV
jgi:hypothetical protein